MNPAAESDLEPEGDRAGLRLYDLIEGVVVCVGLASVVVGSVNDKDNGDTNVSLTLVAAVAILAALDWAIRFVRAFRRRTPKPPMRWLVSRSSVIGLLSFVPIAIAAPLGWTPDSAPLLGVLWVLRFARYAKGVDMLLAVLSREREAVLGVLFLFVSMLMICAVGGYFLEHEGQPDKFGSIPLAIWWTITTLTTTGYGDVVPITPGGRVLAGIMMITGIVVFGLLAGILGTGFSQELRRQEFLRNWDLVKQVRFFRDVGPGIIADVAGLLRSREIPARTVICRRGEPGSAMYFIVSGLVEVLIEPPRHLGPGDFFGEIALLSDGARSATVMATRDTHLLMLDIVDFRALAATRPDLMRSIELESERRVTENAVSGRDR